MVDSSSVFGLMKVVYVVYITIIASFMGFFAFGLWSKKRIEPKIKIPFYGWIGLLICVGVGIHILTFSTIPWVKWDLSRDKMKADREFNIAVADYRFHLPEKQLLIKEGDTVRFHLESRDYTYGFGLFREDGSMVFQMQVVPGNKNDLVWKFDKSEAYTIRSTEYAGPKGGNLFVKNSVVVANKSTFAKLMSQNEIQQN